MNLWIKRIASMGLVFFVLGTSGIFHLRPILPFANGLENNMNAVAKTVRLPAGSPVVLRLTETVDANKVTEGSQISSQVVQDVKVGNTVVIQAGTLVLATVSKADKNGIVGQAGEVVISDFYTTSVEGSRVPLMATLSQEGKDKLPVAILGGFICLPFIFIKGGKAVIPAGTQKTVYTATDVTVSF